MQNRDLSAQARRLSAALNTQLGVTVGHQKALHLLALAQGYASYEELKAATPSPVPPAPAPAPVTTPLRGDALRAHTDASGVLRVTVPVPLETLVRLNDLALTQQLSRDLTGTDLLRNVTYRVHTARPEKDEVLLAVTADASELLRLGGASVPTVDCRVFDEQGEYEESFDGARYFLDFTGAALLDFIRRDPGSSAESLEIALAARSWDADVQDFFHRLPDSRHVECEYCAADVLRLAVTTRPALQGELLEQLRDVDAGTLAEWGVNITEAEARAVKQLHEACDELPLTDDHLDELVHDAKAAEASDGHGERSGSGADEDAHDRKGEEAAEINNAGRAAQLAFLLGHHGSVSAVRRALLDATAAEETHRIVIVEGTGAHGVQYTGTYRIQPGALLRADAVAAFRAQYPQEPWVDDQLNVREVGRTY